MIFDGLFVGGDADVTVDHVGTFHKEYAPRVSGRGVVNVKGGLFGGELLEAGFELGDEGFVEGVGGGVGSRAVLEGDHGVDDGGGA